jgi:hypothetical protein
MHDKKLNEQKRRQDAAAGFAAAMDLDINEAPRCRCEKRSFPPLKTINFPRQAWDKHREMQPKMRALVVLQRRDRRDRGRGEGGGGCETRT